MRPRPRGFQARGQRPRTAYAEQHQRDQRAREQELKLANQRLTEQSQILTTLIENINAGVCLIDRDNLGVKQKPKVLEFPETSTERAELEHFARAVKERRPLALPGVATGVLLVFVPLTGEWVIPSILGGGKSYYLGTFMANQVTDTRNWPLGSAAAVVLIVVMLAVVAAYLRIVGREGFEREVSLL